MAGGRWKVSLRPRADRQLRKLDGQQQSECLDILEGMEEGYFPEDRISLTGHRNFERAKFYRNAYRIIYRVDRRNRAVRVTKIIKRDEKTYAGFNPA